MNVVEEWIDPICTIFVASIHDAVHIAKFQKMLPYIWRPAT